MYTQHFRVSLNFSSVTINFYVKLFYNSDSQAPKRLSDEIPSLLEFPHLNIPYFSTNVEARAYSRQFKQDVRKLNSLLKKIIFYFN